MIWALKLDKVRGWGTGMQERVCLSRNEEENEHLWNKWQTCHAYVLPTCMWCGGCNLSVYVLRPVVLGEEMGSHQQAIRRCWSLNPCNPPNAGKSGWLDRSTRSETWGASHSISYAKHESLGRSWKTWDWRTIVLIPTSEHLQKRPISPSMSPACCFMTPQRYLLPAFAFYQARSCCRLVPPRLLWLKFDSAPYGGLGEP